MLEKHYGRWMESEIPNMAKQVSNKLRDKNDLAANHKKQESL